MSQDHRGWFLGGGVVRDAVSDIYGGDRYTVQQYFLGARSKACGLLTVDYELKDLPKVDRCII